MNKVTEQIKQVKITTYHDIPLHQEKYSVTRYDEVGACTLDIIVKDSKGCIVIDQNLLEQIEDTFDFGM